MEADPALIGSSSSANTLRISPHVLYTHWRNSWPPQRLPRLMAQIPQQPADSINRCNTAVDQPLSKPL